MRPSVILVHGLRTSATMWRSQVASLEERGITAVAVDLPGHGTRIPERFALDSALATIADAVTAATERDGMPPYLVGFSLGGYLSIEWVARNPGRVRGLLAASCGTTPHPIIMGGWRVGAAAIHLLPDRGRALNDATVRLFVKEGAADVLAGGVALEVMQDALIVLGRLRPLQCLPEIDVPVLLVNGQYDHIRIQARKYLAAARQGTLVTVPRATHMVSVTHPAEFTAALLEAYEGVEDLLP